MWILLDAFHWLNKWFCGLRAFWKISTKSHQFKNRPPIEPWSIDHHYMDMHGTYEEETRTELRAENIISFCSTLNITDYFAPIISFHVTHTVHRLLERARKTISSWSHTKNKKKQIRCVYTPMVCVQEQTI